MVVVVVSTAAAVDIAAAVIAKTGNLLRILQQLDSPGHPGLTEQDSCERYNVDRVICTIFQRGYALSVAPFLLKDNPIGVAQKRRRPAGEAGLGSSIADEYLLCPHVRIGVNSLAPGSR